MSSVDVASALIHRWEGCVLTAYPDPATGGDPWTIGWGSTGPGITEGTVWTKEQADADLLSRLSELSFRINQDLRIGMNYNQIGACISLAYNIGIGAFLSSTLLSLWNEGNVQAAADQFLVWNKASGHVMPGLVNRRADEQRVFLGGDP